MPLPCSGTVVGVFRPCHRGYGRSFQPSQPERLALQLAKAGSKFFDFDELVFLHVRKLLPRIARGPPELEGHDPCRLAQPDMLLHGIGTERSSAAHGAVTG